MKTIRISLASLLLSFSAQMAQAQTVDAPPLHLQLPSTWTLDSARRPMEGKGPDGEKMMVTIARALPNKTTTAREDPVGRAKSPTPGRVKIPHLLTA